MTDLNALLKWLAVYVAALLLVSVFAGKPLEVVPVLSNLISGFAGAAFAIMRGARKDSVK
jgi:hypothetical protein